jgi:hypothetical protein
MPQPHGGANAESGVSAQGYLAAAEKDLLVPTGRAVPAAFARPDGKFLYYHLQANGHVGGTDDAGNRRQLLQRRLRFQSRDRRPGGEARRRAASRKFLGGIVHGSPDALRMLKVVEKTVPDRKGIPKKIDHAGGVVAPGTWTRAPP